MDGGGNLCTREHASVLLYAQDVTMLTLQQTNLGATSVRRPGQWSSWWDRQAWTDSKTNWSSSSWSASK